jgi:hypothetical protein
MLAYRDGQKVFLCDGCWRPIENFRARSNNIIVGPGRICNAHACSVKCALAAKARPPKETRCPECGVLVASGELSCMNKHVQVKRGVSTNVVIKNSNTTVE